MAANSVGKLTLKLLFGAAAMFVFAIFVMPPLYNVFCDITGIGGKTKGPYVAEPAGVDTSRVVRVQFVTTTNSDMPWEFRPEVTEVRVHPGEPTAVSFFARNTTGKDMVAQAIPSIAPFNAAEYFHKTQCFCFNRQPLSAGNAADMPVVFIVDKDLPEAVTTITLSYTLFDVTGRFESDLAKLN